MLQDIKFCFCSNKCIVIIIIIILFSLPIPSSVANGGKQKKIYSSGLLFRAIKSFEFRSIKNI